MPAEFHFLRPEWLAALPFVLLATLALARRKLAPGSWQRVVSPALLPYVLSAKPTRGLTYRWWLLALGGVLATLALAGPTWNRIEQPVFRSEQAVVVALDLSRSMDAQDVAPSRLTRARLKIIDILAERQSGQTALVVFSSNAFTVTPLTTDTDTVAALVNSLSTDIMPSRGSYPVAAIRKGQQLLEQAGAVFGEVLLITDGGTSPEAEDAAGDLVDAGFTLSVLGVGTSDGAPIPRAGGGFVTDRSGNIAVPRLAKDQLRRLAAAGHGRYETMTTDNSDIKALLSGKVAVGAGADTGQTLATDQWREEGPWLLLLLLPIAALAFRRGMVIGLAFFMLPMTEPAHAFGWDDLWLNKNQQGQRKLAEALPDEAAQLFKDPRWRAVAEYEAGNFASSARAFADRDDASSLYNMGNAMARAGKLEPAIEAYDQALEQTPGDEDTIYNRDLVAKLLQQQQEQGDQQDGQQSDADPGGQSQQSESESDANQENQQDSSGESGSESNEGEAGRNEQETNQEDLQAMREELERAAAEAEAREPDPSETEAMTEAQAEAMRRAQEQTQAMEQWLRRIENDPGGLLRRKFRYQYQREGRDQDGNSVWPDDDVEPW
jgi:Ca-activated chloride channel family protein